MRWIAGREELTDVAEREAGQQRVRHGVKQHVTIGVRVGSAWAVRNLNSADDECSPRYQPMGIEAVSDADAGLHAGCYQGAHAQAVQFLERV